MIWWYEIRLTSINHYYRHMMIWIDMSIIFGLMVEVSNGPLNLTSLTHLALLRQSGRENRIWGTTPDVLRSCRRANLDLHCLLAKGKDFIWSQAGTSGTNLIFRHLDPFWAFWAFWALTSHEANQQLPSCANQILAVLCTESSPLDLASWDQLSIAGAAKPQWECWHDSRLLVTAPRTG